MIVAVVRSRLKPNIETDYQPVAQRMSELARTVPGYIAHKGFFAPDGERVTLVEFENEEALEAWRTHPEHLDAKRRGYRDFYTHFRFQLCHVFRDKSWAAKEKR
jgi:heme-degrading monooxygenase HmoA